MFTQTALFLIKTVFELYIMVLMLRVFLQYFHANFYNPVSQLVIKLTNPVITPIKPYVPGFKGIDLSVVLLVFLLEIIKMLLLVKLSIGAWPPVSTIIVVGFFEMQSDAVMFLFYLVLLRVILSWIGTPQSGPLQEICFLITEPMFAPVRRLIPLVSGFDLSPIAITIGLLAINTFLKAVIYTMI